MKLPRKNKQWAKEALQALSLAHQMVLENDNEEIDLNNETIFMLAPYFCSNNRRIADKRKDKEMFDYITGEMIAQLAKFPDDMANYNINFLLAYFDSHVYLKLISDKKQDEIMNYILENYDI